MKRKTTIIGAGLLVFALVQLVSTAKNLYMGKPHAEQFATPSRQEIQVTQGGRYHLWYHHKTIFDGERISLPDRLPSNISFKLTDSEGQELELSQEDKQSWRIGNYAKKSLGHADLKSKQSVIVSTEGGVERGAILSFSRANVKVELWQALGGFAYAVVSALVGLPLFIWGLITSKS